MIETDRQSKVACNGDGEEGREGKASKVAPDIEIDNVTLYLSRQKEKKKKRG